MEKLSETERLSLKSKLKKLKQRYRALSKDLDNVMLSFEEREDKEKELKEVSFAIKKIKSHLNNDYLFGGLSPEEVEKKKEKIKIGNDKALAKKLRKKTRHTWGTSTMRVFGTENKGKPHRRVNMGEGGSTKHISTKDSVHMIYTPTGGQNKKY